MNVKELIDKLKQYPDDMKVCFDYESGWSAYEVEDVTIARKYNGGKVIGEEVVILK